MVTWFFENNHFADAWVPFDRSNQKKLEYVYRHLEEITLQIQQNQNRAPIKDIDTEEEDASIHAHVGYDHNCISVSLNDSHFDQPITLYPAMLLGSLPDRDILIVRAEMMDHKNKYLLDD